MLKTNWRLGKILSDIALNDSIAIYGPGNRQLFVNDVAYRRFKTYYQGMADGQSHKEALLAANRQGMPNATDAEVHEAADRPVPVLPERRRPT